MTEKTCCPDCGAALPPNNLCTRCMLNVGLEPPHMHIRCPHCRNPIEVLHDAPLHDITCPSCDSKFSLIAETETVSCSGSVNQKLNQFVLLETLGTGSFGTVWKAHDTELDRDVAVKIPRNTQLSGEETEQFFREARAAAQLRHPNIVSVHEVGREDGSVYIVSDYVPGVDLSNWLSVYHPTSREAADLCRKIAEAFRTCPRTGYRAPRPEAIQYHAGSRSRASHHGLWFGQA